MNKRMLIDATHAEETRVVVLDGNRLEDFDVETSTKKQLKGNIYLAKVIRVEPSLQAAFVEYGGGRHGFLAFGEIHPDYYQIPVADRQRLLEMQAQEAREEEEAEEAAERAAAAREERRPDRHRDQRPANGRAGSPPPSADAGESVADGDAAHEAAASNLDGDGDGEGESGEAERFEPDSVAPAADLAHDPADEREPRHEAEDDHAEHGRHGRGDDGRGDDGRGDDGHDDGGHGGESSPGYSSGEPDRADHVAGGEHDGDDHRSAQPAAIASDMRYGEDITVHAGESIHVPGAGGYQDDAFQNEPEPEHDRGPETERDANGHYEENAGGENPPDPLDAPAEQQAPPETIGGETDTVDGAAEARARRASRLLRNYRIQEVIRRRQIMLIQVVKEERGTKGAALTTYISLAGRFCVLMPNSPRGGGISRKITSAADRRRLKEITTELEIPRGMGLIVRTAGANRPKPEIKRDCEYLMRLWDDIREHTMQSMAPALIYEEASLIKRAIRDVYSRDVDEILVDGEQGWKAAHDFMRMLMPSHARKVIQWRSASSGGQSLFGKQNVEAQLDSMLSPTVQLRSGGYLVIAQTEALVSIDVNSGRSTRERGIEETALKTNLEAADEVARTLRLRDLAGLIVIDFIDMEARKHNAMVERRLKDALKNDRARIQVGSISHFGLLEMSRQRLRPSLAETSFVVCPHCVGAGLVRGIESSAIHVLRDIEDEGSKRRASLIMVHCGSAVVMYLLNNKRERLADIEQRFAMRVHFTPDDVLIPPALRIDRLKPPLADSDLPAARPVIPAAPVSGLPVVDDDDVEFEADSDDYDRDERDVAPATPPRAVANAVSANGASANGASAPGTPSNARPVGDDSQMVTGEDGVRRRRRRRRRSGRRDPSEAIDGGAQPSSAGSTASDDELPFGPEHGDEPFPSDDGPHDSLPLDIGAELGTSELEARAPAALGDDGQPIIDPADFDENGLPRSRGPRRGRRGGRRRRREEGDAAPATAEAANGETPAEGESPRAAPAHQASVQKAPAYEPPRYTGPTPANPFGGQVFDIFDMMDPEHPINQPPPPPPAPAFVPEPPIDIPPVPANATAAHEVETHVEPPPPAEHVEGQAELAVSHDRTPLADEPPPALAHPEHAAAHPEPVAAEPVPVEAALVEPPPAAPAQVEAATPEPAAPEPASPEPASPEPASPEAAAPEVVAQEIVASEIAPEELPPPLRPSSRS